MNPALRRSAAHAFVESIESPHLDDHDQHHLTRVLRLRRGEVVSVSDGAGRWRLCEFVDGGGLVAGTDVFVEPARATAITVGFALAKGDRPEWVVQKLTEIGVDRMIVVHAERSVTVWDGERAARNLGKLERVAREAAMQSRRVRLPEIIGPMPVSAVADLASPGTTGGGAIGLALAEPDGAPLSIEDHCVLIGPEGGWSPSELAGTDRHVTLGEPILRVETAAMVAAVRMVDLRSTG